MDKINLPQFGCGIEGNGKVNQDVSSRDAPLSIRQAFEAWYNQKLENNQVKDPLRRSGEGYDFQGPSLMWEAYLDAHDVTLQMASADMSPSP